MPTCHDISYKRGEFFQMLVAPYVLDVDEMASPRPYFGLIPYQTYPYGCVRTEDGAMFEVLRNLYAEGSPSKTMWNLLVQSTDVDGQNLLPHQEIMARGAQAHRSTLIRDGEAAVWRKVADDAGADWEIRITSSTFDWVEAGILSLHGTFLTPGCQWYLPGPEYGTFYVNNFLGVEGEILGRRCRGIICFDTFYLHPDDAQLYFSKDIMMENKGHILWYMFGTRYDDGSAEWGQFIVGHDRMGFGFVADSAGRCTGTNNVEATVHIADPASPFTGTIDLTIDGEEWQFLPDPRGKMPMMLKREPPTPQQEGRWQRKGETRTPVAWFAWGETEREHGLTREPMLPTRRSQFVASAR